MYCNVCGNQLTGNEIACDRCGNAVAIAKKNEINLKEDVIREAQICHLNDVLNLECAHKALLDKLAQMNNAIASLGKPNTYFAPYLDLKPEKEKLKKAVLMFIFFILAGFKLFSQYKTVLLCAYVIIIGVFALSVIRYITNTHKKKKRYNLAQENYNKEILKDEKRVADELRRKETLQIQYLSVCEDLKKSYKILNDAYSANIIPAPYRNIYSVYYLKQFLSTSSISFSDALLHCNLENIKTAVEGVINQQRYIIVQNAVANAINGKNMNHIISQNYDILKKAAEIENNSRIAANYSRAAAANSAASTLFSSLTYFS